MEAAQSPSGLLESVYYPLVNFHISVEHGHRNSGNLPIKDGDFTRFYMAM